MLVYKVIKDDVESLISALQKFRNESEYYYAVRDWDRKQNNVYYHYLMSTRLPEFYI
jgi:site-specific DNA-adenine methylase